MNLKCLQIFSEKCHHVFDDKMPKSKEGCGVCLVPKTFIAIDFIKSYWSGYKCCCEAWGRQRSHQDRYHHTSLKKHKMKQKSPASLQFRNRIPPSTKEKLSKKRLNDVMY